jgi:hypothetical protein
MSDIFWARSVALSVSRDLKFTPQDANLKINGLGRETSG